MHSLDYGLMDAPLDFWIKDRWTVLTFLLLHANARNRCWPSMKRIAAQLHRSQPYIIDAKKWLIEHEAIRIVTKRERTEDEKNVHQRQTIYELTGKFTFEGKAYPYLYIPTKNGENSKPRLSLIEENSKRGESLTTFTLTVSSKKEESTISNTVSAPALQSIQAECPDPKPDPETLTIPEQKPIKVPRKAAPPPSKQVKKSASTPGARAGRKPQRLDPFWNAFADTLYQGARNGNQRLARVMFGQKDHGLFGLIAYECEHQNCQEEKLDYAAMALWVPKFYASLPKDNSGKTIELRDPAKVVERWIGWRETQNRISCPPHLKYDPDCPHRFDANPCEKGMVTKKNENGELVTEECICVAIKREQKRMEDLKRNE